ncbi:helix-turn-helix transcriptional regulator [Rossellomorea marisflavi]|uniref:helix-turn-helix transcriptional regulator n=1 Tax=Rossellomorea marisflavi TaxID=189381 RepID=UPI00296FA0EE|nr:helix-turn-helix transcriptional regulator [Rossellomorea marisflavi]MDW4528227.1 helix-turn-helix transcriptional regulator [Rossellomorea marisflavi]
MKLAEIGKKICELRNEMNLTQGELAEGICTQALISLIEKGESDPNATILYQIAKKLGVDVNYFFHIGSTPRLDYIVEVKKQLRTLRINYKFQEMKEIIRPEEKNPLFYNDPGNMQYMLWHKSIYAFEVEKDYSKAVSIMEEALALMPNKKRAYTELELEMLMSLGGCEHRSNRFEHAIDYFNKVETALVGTKRILVDKTIQSRLYYHLARAHTRLGHYLQSISLATKGIQWNIQHEQLYLMPVLHYQIAYNYELMDQYEKTLEYLDYSLQLFEFYPDNPAGGFVLEKRSEYVRRVNQ